MSIVRKKDYIELNMAILKFSDYLTVEVERTIATTRTAAIVYLTIISEMLRLIRNAPNDLATPRMAATARLWNI